MARREACASRLYSLSLLRPLLVPLILLAIAVALCVVDIMVLPLAERWGEAFLHKALGFVLVLAYLWAAGQSVADARAQALGIVGRLDSIREWLWLVSDRSRHRPAPVSL